MRRALWLLVGLAACGTPDCPEGYDQRDRLCLEREADVADPVCDAGFELRGGVCYEVAADPEVAEVLMSAWPECSSVDGDGTLDLENGCAGGICVGMTHARANDEAGAAECEAAGSGFDQCTWPNGVRAYLVDGDQDGVPDADGLIQELILFFPFAGTTDDGAGVDVEMSCWAESLGSPDQMGVEDLGAGFEIRWIWWRAYDLNVYDYLDAQGEIGRDGYADWIYLVGRQD